MKRHLSFKSRRFLFSALAVVLCAGLLFTGLPYFHQPVSAEKGNIAGVPKHVMVGYWHNFFNGTTRTRLKDVPESWNVINLSFGEPSDRKGLVEFAPYSDLYSSDEEFIKEVDICHARGQKVVLSIGGQNGVCTLSTAADRDNFVRTCTGIIDKYHLDGLDIDFEGHSISLVDGDTNLKHPTSPSVVNLIDALNAICDHYGKDFILTMAPETLLCQNGCAFYGGQGDSRNGVYLPVIDALRDKLSWLQVQYYNVASCYTPEGLINNPGTVEFNVHTMDMMLEGFYIGNFFAGLPGALPQDEDHYFEGLRPDQIVMGVPSGTGSAGAGVMTPDKYIEAMELMRNGGKAGSYTVKNPSKDFRGIMTWSINWDEFHGHNFSSVIGPYLDKINAEDTPAIPVMIESIKADRADNITIGTDINWSVSASGGNKPPLMYKYELFLNGKSQSVADFSTSSTFTYKPTAAGTYYIEVTVKDGKEQSAKMQSAAINAVDGVSIGTLTANCSGSVPAGKDIIWTATPVGSAGNPTYTYEIYKDNQMIEKSNSTNQNTFKYTPSQPGVYKLKVTVSEAGKSSFRFSDPITVTPQLKVDKITADKTGTVAKNVSVTFTATASGGAPAKNYRLFVLKDGSIYYKSNWSKQAQFTYTTQAPGNYRVLVYCQDESGSVAAGYSTLSVS